MVTPSPEFVVEELRDRIAALENELDYATRSIKFLDSAFKQVEKERLRLADELSRIKFPDTTGQ